MPITFVIIAIGLLVGGAVATATRKHPVSGFPQWTNPGNLIPVRKSEASGFGGGDFAQPLNDIAKVIHAGSAISAAGLTQAGEVIHSGNPNPVTAPWSSTITPSGVTQLISPSGSVVGGSVPIAGVAPSTSTGGGSGSFTA